MNVEHTGDCNGSWDANLTVSGNANQATASIDDVTMKAEEVTPDPAGPTKGTKILVVQTNSPPQAQLGDVEVLDLSTDSAYDFYGTMALMDGVVYLDDIQFDEHIVKDFWEVDEIAESEPPPGTSSGGQTRRVLDRGYELITKAGYPRSKWDQSSYLWRSNGGNGYILIEKSLIAPDPGNNPCNIRYSALVGNYAGGFQTISGTVDLEGAVDADLAVTKTESADPVVAGSGAGNLVYLITLTNNGPLDATGVELTEILVLPDGVSVLSITPSQGTYADPVWSVGDLARGKR